MTPRPPPRPSGPSQPWQYRKKIASPCCASPAAIAAGSMIGDSDEATTAKQQNRAARPPFPPICKCSFCFVCPDVRPCCRCGPQLLVPETTSGRPCILILLL